MMGASDVLHTVDLLAGAGVRVWLDGGWGVDALLGEQTREHDDLDIVVPIPDADAARRALEAAGFAIVEDEATAQFVARAADDRRVDVHTVAFDDEGAGWQRLADGGRWRYPPKGFAGEGWVVGRRVACLTAEVQILCHTGYDPDDGDRRDVALLAARFGLVPPAPYGP